MPTPNEPEPLVYASFLRRFGAILYDALILLALAMLETALILPLTGGEAIQHGQPLEPLYQTYLFLLAFAYFAWFWGRGGQTIGMRAWRIRVQRDDGTALTLWQILLRFLAAIGSWLLLGTGYLYALFNTKQQTWHDRFSESELIVVKSEKRSWF